MATTTELSNLTKEQIFKAFEKTKEQVNNIKDVTLVLVTEEMQETVMRFIGDDFAMNEPINAALGLDKQSPDLKAYLASCLKLNMSFAIVHQHTKEVMGVVILGIVRSDDTIDRSVITDGKFRAIVEALDTLHAKINIFKYYGVTELFTIKAMSVGSNYSNRGIGKYLTSTVLKYVQNLAGVYPIYMVAEVTSAITRKFCEKVGCEELASINYEDYLKDGVQLIRGTGSHKKMSLFGLCISSPDHFKI